MDYFRALVALYLDAVDSAWDDGYLNPEFAFLLVEQDEDDGSYWLSSHESLEALADYRHSQELRWQAFLVVDVRDGQRYIEDLVPTYRRFLEPKTCILTGADGEDSDDCTTHDHEDDGTETAARLTQQWERREAAGLHVCATCDKEVGDDHPAEEQLPDGTWRHVE